MVSPRDVVRFHEKFDVHPGDRVRLFAAVANHLPSARTVLYAGSFVDIAPSTAFDDVTYVDTDDRASKFFDEAAAVAALTESIRPVASAVEPTISFVHEDYRNQLPLDDGSVDLLVSLYAGFITEYCTRYVRVGGHIFCNNSHGDASMASLDDRLELGGVVISRDGDYVVKTSSLDAYLEPKRGAAPTRDQLHESNRGIAYVKPAFGYIFTRTS